MDKKYRILEMIDEGSFGDIFTIQTLSEGNVFVLKQISYRGNLMKNDYIIGEIECLRNLKHDHIIQFEEVYINSNSVNLILEYAEKGNLENYLRERFPLKEIFLGRFCLQILKAIAFCHSYGIAHRDLTPSNVLITADHVIKLADFGLAVCAVSNEGEVVLCEDYLGNVPYLAPEVLREVPYNALMADLWSTGILLYYFIFGKILFQGTAEDVLCNSREVPKFLCSLNTTSFTRTETIILKQIRNLLKIPPVERSLISRLLDDVKTEMASHVLCCHMSGMIENMSDLSETEVITKPSRDLVCGMVTCDDTLRQV